MKETESPLILSMDRVVRVFHRAALDSSPETIHDLRVALRRCRSLAYGLSDLKHSPLLRLVSRQSKVLFRGLASLRNLHVRIHWMETLMPRRDTAARRLLKELRSLERKSSLQIDRVLDDFDVAHWKNLRDRIVSRKIDETVKPREAARVSLERLGECERLHARALRGADDHAWHRLRIGFKKFRYFTTEFVPLKAHPGEGPLRKIQDALGEAHDLAELLAFLEREFGMRRVPKTWRRRITGEREKRLKAYRRYIGNGKKVKEGRKRLNRLCG